jgi:ribose transport system substrate-binding protein
LIGEHLAKSSGGMPWSRFSRGFLGTGDSRVRGFRDAIKNSPGITIVASQTANWERDQGFTVFQNMLQAHPDIDTLFACNDLMALGAPSDGRGAAHRQIRVLGFDASRMPAARSPLDHGGDRRAVSDEMGRIAVESAVKGSRGGDA